MKGSTVADCTYGSSARLQQRHPGVVAVLMAPSYKTKKRPEVPKEEETQAQSKKT